MVMEFCGWIDLIKGECSAHEPKLLLAYFLSYYPLFFFILEFSGAYLQGYILGMAMKFPGRLQLGVRRAYLTKICRSC